MASAATDCRIECGSIPVGATVAEDGSLNVTGFNVDYSRQETLFADSEGCTVGSRYYDAKAEITLEGEVITQATNDLTDMHVGDSMATNVTYTALANFVAGRGHDPAVGCVILTGSSTSQDLDRMTISQNFVHYENMV